MTKEWLKDFHKGVRKNTQYDRRLGIFLGALLLGLTLGALLGKDVSVSVAILQLPIILFNLYWGFSKPYSVALRKGGTDD